MTDFYDARLEEGADDGPLPEQVGEPAEVEIDFKPDEFGIEVTAIFGNASIKVEHAWESAEEAATLIQALPNIMIAVQEALESQEDS